MTFLAVILFIVYFSCSVNSKIIQNPKLPVLRYNDNGLLDTSISSRIVGGTPAVAGEFQGKISIQQAAYYPNIVYHFCGGTLIHASHVLTAAHCVTTDSGSVIRPSFFYERKYLGFVVYVGRRRTLSELFSVSRQARTASYVFVHPEYSVQGILNDIAMIRTSSPFFATSTFSPVTRIQYSPIPGVSCSVAGWGAIYFEGPLSTTLLRINATVIDRVVCNSNDSYEGYVKDGMLCAGNMNGRFDACQGDSGGGLICGNYIAGVVSWGSGCALPNLPGVYTDVAVYNNWIEEKIYWAGEQADIPTPTTVAVDATTGSPNDSAATAVTLNLIFACIFVLTWTQ